MKTSGITFDSIDCDTLQYINRSHSWVCLDLFTDLDDVSFCMHCRFADLKLREDEIRKAIKKEKIHA